MSRCLRFGDCMGSESRVQLDCIYGFCAFACLNLHALHIQACGGVSPLLESFLRNCQLPDNF